MNADPQTVQNFEVTKKEINLFLVILVLKGNS